MGVVGIHIHGLKDADGQISCKGFNPFDFIKIPSTGRKPSSIIRCYDPPGNDSREIYKWIEENIAGLVEEAILIRGKSR